MCPDCAARRQLIRNAFLNAKIAEAIGHVAKGAAEIVGLKEKTGAADIKSRPTRDRPATTKK